MKKFRSLSISTALILVLSGCSTVADISDGVVDVTESVVDTVLGRDAETAAQEESAPGADGEFPKIADVPQRPVRPVIASEYQKLTSGLVSDNQNAKYTDQVIRNGQVSTVDLEASQTAQTARAATTNNTGNIPVPPTVSSSTIASTNSQIQARAGQVRQVPQAGQIQSGQVLSTANGQAVTSVEQPSTLPSVPALPAEPTLPQNQGYNSNQFQVPATVQETFNRSSFAGIQTDTQYLPQDSTVGIAANQAEEAAQNGTHIATLYYDLGSAALSNFERDVLSQVADIYRSKATKGIVVIGHASTLVSSRVSNPALINYKVSLERATGVTTQLQKYGVPEQAIVMDARGANSPARLGETAEDHAFNQRTEIYFLK